MNEEMRRSDRLLPEEETRTMLEQGEYGVLATVGEDGVPYGVPQNYVVVGNKLYFHGTNQGGKRARNIAANPKVCFTVVTSTEVMPEKFGTKYASVIVFGTIRIAETEEERMEGLRGLIDKYSLHFKEAGEKYIQAMWDKVEVFVIDMESYTGKARKQ